MTLLHQNRTVTGYGFFVNPESFNEEFPNQNHSRMEMAAVSLLISGNISFKALSYF